MHFYNQMSKAIKKSIPEAVCLLNEIPYSWRLEANYKDLRRTVDRGFSFTPRLGAFEISTQNQY